jgi:transposase
VLDIREIIRQLRDGRSCRAVGRSVQADHSTISAYQKWGASKGWLAHDVALPEAAVIEQALSELRGALPSQNASSVVALHDVIAVMVGQELEAVVIHQRLTQPPHRFTGSYHAIYRYIRKHFKSAQEAYIRIETQAGEEGQVDFGFAGLMWDPVTKRVRRAWIFILTLSWSRHQFARHVFDQTIGTWLDCHKRAFEYFGGVPGRIVLDNLKAGITKACFDDPVVTRAYREFSEHYGFSAEPCHVRSPREKGKVENGVRYYKRNFLAGRTYKNAVQDIHAANRDVLHWIEQTAGLRLHGTTRKQPLPRFQAGERDVLRALPPTPYEAVTWKRVKLHRDCHVTFDNAYYSAPCVHVGEILWVRATALKIELWHNNNRAALHTRSLEQGVFVTEKAHLPEHKQAAFDALHGRGAPHAVSRKRAAAIGPFTHICVDRLLDNPAHDRRRTVERLIDLADQHSQQLLERACKHAVQSGDLSSHTIRTLFKLCLSGALPDDDKTAVAPPSSTVPRFARRADELVPVAWMTPA